MSAAVKFESESPREKFDRQQARARKHRIQWELSFIQWCELWDDAGKWDDMGNCADGYGVVRIHNRGTFKTGNVRLVGRPPVRKRSHFTQVHWMPPEDEGWQHVHSAPDVGDDDLP